MKKSDVEKLKIIDFSYSLRDSKIAKYPLQQRDKSKLLISKDDSISTDIFRNICNHLPDNSLMIFNDTKVIHARLLFRKASGALIEIFCLSPNMPRDYVINFQERETCLWNCMIGNSKRWKDEVLEMAISIEGKETILSAKKVSKTENDTVVQFSWNNDKLTFSELLEVTGKIPIPPYLNRDAETSDEITYQTIYSKIEGSVAAPTAGLHFTPQVMERLKQQNIATVNVTLHVGAGTFKPVKSETIGAHDMHTELISIDRDTLRKLYENHNRLIVTGTTSMRTIESLYYIGKKLNNNPGIKQKDLFVGQWDPYDEVDPILPRTALKNIIDYLDNHKLKQLIASTQIMIVPGYDFHFCDAIITNFHQPESTLLLLISAFVGKKWKKIYDYALDNDFRFLSYGDSSLLWKDDKMV